MDDLLVATAGGSVPAFRELYAAMHHRLVGLALEVVRDRGFAEDVVQETFAEIWSRADRFRPELGSAVSWMLRLAHGRAIDRVRAEESERTRMTDAGVRSLADVEPSTAERMESEERAVVLHAALGLLSSLQREAIVLTHLDGHSFPDAAALLGIPVGTLKSRAHDGMLQLRRLLGAPASVTPLPERELVSAA